MTVTPVTTRLTGEHGALRQSNRSLYLGRTSPPQASVLTPLIAEQSHSNLSAECLMLAERPVLYILMF